MKKIFILFSFLLTYQFSYTQPANDDCPGLIDLGIAPACDTNFIYNNVDATESNIGFDNFPTMCEPNDLDISFVGRDVWFSFVASDTILDYTISVIGCPDPVNGHPSIINPQLSLYRGDCEFDGLQLLECYITEDGETSLEMDISGLTPGITYFLRVNDWSASAAPNSGGFKLCVKEQEPCFNIAEEDFNTGCFGKLVDSGGEDGDYGNNENFTFTICPNEFHQCIIINIEEYNIGTFDQLTFYAGEDVLSPQIISLTGSGEEFEVQAASDCVTIEFSSDFNVTNEGFLLTWQCSAEECTVPPLISCDDPEPVMSLPYTNTNLSTCFAGNTLQDGPCNDFDEFFLGGEEYIFAYESPGDECIAVQISNSNAETGLAIYNDCPNVADDCLGIVPGAFGVSDPSIEGVFLEEPGTYYIVVGNDGNCTGFDINIENSDCPLPSAEDCEDAVGINGCGNQPQVITVAQMPSNNTNFQLGCWGGTGAGLFTWFFFQAQEDGNFGFLAEDNTNMGTSDIDINVWGPYTSEELLCDGTLTDEPARSTWSGQPGVTGLTDFHPVTGDPITDICEGAGGDKFVSTIPVLEGEWYVVLVLDFGGTIENGEISMDFTSTSDGVLAPLEDDFTVTQDTVVCPGEIVQLMANGGDFIQWVEHPALSCTFCSDPIATIDETSVFEVAILGACNSDTLEVEVGLLQVDAGPDVTVCLGEEIQIVAGSNFENVFYEWSGSPGTLSCTDCPDPIVTAVSAGNFNYSVTVTGPSCSFSDEMIIEVLDAQVPVFEISDDQQICLGDVINIGGTTTAGVAYSWTSSDGTFNSNIANPQVNPAQTTTYYLSASTGECVIGSLDSVLVEVAPVPIIELADDILICQGDSIALSSMEVEDGVTYSWNPDGELDNPTAPNPIAIPSQTTTFTVTANRNGCEIQESITIEVTEINVVLDLPEEVGICIGGDVPINAIPSPVGTEVNWTPGDGSLNTQIGESVIATPETGTLYIASVEVPGCIKSDSVFVVVDSLPADLGIMPADTTICAGEQVLLTSLIYEPALYQQMDFQWTPTTGQITPDSLFNMVVQPTDTTVYQRVTTNGFCTNIETAVVNVLDVDDLSAEVIDPICEGESVQLNLINPPVGEISWSPELGLSCTDCPNPIANPSTTTTYQVEVDVDGCPVGTSVTVEVLEAPFVEFPNNVLCFGENIPALNLAPNPGWSYFWTSDDPDFMDSNENTPIANPTQNSTYYVTVTDPTGSCPEYVDSLMVFIGEEVEFTLPMTTTICEGMTATFSFDATIPGDIQWFNPDSSICNECPNVTGFNPDTLTYQVVYSNSCYEEFPFQDPDTFNITLIVVEGVMIDEIIMDPSLSEVFEGTPIDLTASVSNTLDSLEYIWTTGDIDSMITVIPLISELGNVATYSVSVTDELGCSDFQSISFDLLESDYDIPNAFTPNGQEPNDIFEIIIRGENIEVESFQIWNRWGDLVHSKDGTDHGWDGMQNNKPAPADVYIFGAVLKLASGETVTEKGDVTLIR